MMDPMVLDEIQEQAEMMRGTLLKDSMRATLLALVAEVRQAQEAMASVALLPDYCHDPDECRAANQDANEEIECVCGVFADNQVLETVRHLTRGEAG
jgi:hypothetical protein